MIEGTLIDHEAVEAGVTAGDPVALHVTVTVDDSITDLSDLDYALDGGAYQASNVFIDVIAGVGHYIDVFQLISPATVGDRWYIGIPELASISFFAGLFIFTVFNAIGKVPLLAKGNPFIKESEIYHY